MGLEDCTCSVAVNWSELFDKILMYIEQLIFSFCFNVWPFQSVLLINSFSDVSKVLKPVDSHFSVSEFTVTVQLSCCAWVKPTDSSKKMEISYS
jgi:hypothetical protein